MTAAEEIDFAVRTALMASERWNRERPELTPYCSGLIAQARALPQYAESVETIKARWEDGMERIHGRNGAQEGRRAA